MTIDNNKITANTGMVLMRISDKYIVGNEITLGYTYYIGGVKLTTPHLEVPEDYTDVYIINVEGIDYPVDRYEYGYLKAYIIKMRYSYDDQIAILSNFAAEPDNEGYKTRYDAMQAWRKTAGEIALRYAS